MATTDASTTPEFPRPRWVGISRSLGFVVGGIAWMMVVILATSVFMMARAHSEGHDLAQMAQMDELELIGATTLAAITAIQTGGLLAITVLLSVVLWAPSPTGRLTFQSPDWPNLWPRLRETFATRSPRMAALVLGAIGGFVVGIGPGWLAELVKEALPGLNLGNNEMIGSLLSEGPVMGRVAMITMVVVFAPLTEELIFRGYLWNAMEHLVPGWAVWLLTSVFFALFHIDPVSAVALIFTGAFLGWLRWVSGSVWPAVAAHGANNLLAATAALTVGMEAEEAMPWWGAGLAFAATLALAAAAYRFGPQRSP